MCHHFHNCFQTLILYIMTRSVLQRTKNIPRIEIHLPYVSSKKLSWCIICGDSVSLQTTSKTFPPPLTGYTRAHTILLSSDSIKKISGHQTQELKQFLYLAQRLCISLSFLLLKLKTHFTDVSKTLIYLKCKHMFKMLWSSKPFTCYFIKTLLQAYDMI